MKAAFDLEQCDETTKNFFTKVFSRYPDWRRFAFSEQINEEWIPTVSVTSPHDHNKSLLIWSDAASGPSAEFNGWHTHVDLFESEESFFEAIEGILTDKLVVIRHETKDGEWAGCSLVEVESEDILDYATAPGRPEIVRIISWSGKHDRTL